MSINISIDPAKAKSLKISTESANLRLKILDLSNGGHTVAGMAKILGVSKNRIAGMRHRMGLSHPEKNPIKHSRSETIGAISKIAIKNRKHRKVLAPLQPRDKAVIIEAVQEILTRRSEPPAERQISPERFLANITDNKNACSWLLDTGTARRPNYCNEDVVPGKPYCQHHCNIAYTGQTAGSKKL